MSFPEYELGTEATGGGLLRFIDAAQRKIQDANRPRIHVSMMNWNELLEQARTAREKAHAPYSRFAVGAALLGKSGRVFVGCNVENLSYGLTICAERNAVFAAVAAGEREFERIAIVADSKTPVSPCGACRQVLAEFCPELEIVTANLEGEQFEAKLTELLPRAREGILGT
jgi:cytidine deaminase